MSAPAPGIIPVAVPIPADRRIVPMIVLNSLHFNFTFSTVIFTWLTENKSSIDLNASEVANKPIIIGIKLIPLVSSVNPKVNLGNPPIGSNPMVEMSKPNTPAINPLTRDDPATLEMIDKPKKASANVSGALNFKAKLANCGATSMRTMTLRNPPVAAEMVETVKALFAKPLLAKG